MNVDLIRNDSLGGVIVDVGRIHQAAQREEENRDREMGQVFHHFRSPTSERIELEGEGGESN